MAAPQTKYFGWLADTISRHRQNNRNRNHSLQPANIIAFVTIRFYYDYNLACHSSICTRCLFIFILDNPNRQMYICERKLMSRNFRQ